MMDVTFATAAGLAALRRIGRRARLWWRAGLFAAAFMASRLVVLAGMLPVLVAATWAAEAARMFIFVTHHQRSCCKPLCVVFCLMFPARPCSARLPSADPVDVPSATFALFRSEPYLGC